MNDDWRVSNDSLLLHFQCVCQSGRISGPVTWYVYRYTRRDTPAKIIPLIYPIPNPLSGSISYQLEISTPTFPTFDWSPSTTFSHQNSPTVRAPLIQSTRVFRASKQFNYSTPSPFSPSNHSRISLFSRYHINHANADFTRQIPVKPPATLPSRWSIIKINVVKMFIRLLQCLNKDDMANGIGKNQSEFSFNKM